MGDRSGCALREIGHFRHTFSEERSDCNRNGNCDGLTKHGSTPKEESNYNTNSLCCDKIEGRSSQRFDGLRHAALSLPGTLLIHEMDHARGPKFAIKFRIFAMYARCTHFKLVLFTGVNRIRIVLSITTGHLHRPGLVIRLSAVLPGSWNHNLVTTLPVRVNVIAALSGKEAADPLPAESIG